MRRLVPSDLHTSLLIVGAGPFGLAMAAEARARGLEHLVVGEPMSFWRRQMPRGMLLRSACDWHLDPRGRDTIVRFLGARGQDPSDVEPLPLALYLEYAEWFAHEQEIRPTPTRVSRLDQHAGAFVARIDDGSTVSADRVVLALGFAPFAHVPDDLAARIPADKRSHTSVSVVPERFRGRRVLIVGGRQSAFESAALLAEAGAAAVHICHRHETPAFARSDWGFVEPLLDRIEAEPEWYRGLPAGEKEALNRRFWEEGRLKLEPWLGPRVDRDAIVIHSRSRIAAVERSGNALRIGLDRGDQLDVDHVLLATGYKVDLARVPLLASGNLLGRIARREGFPVLDSSLQTTIPGLFITSLPAAGDFGVCFGFTVAVRAAARMVGRAL